MKPAILSVVLVLIVATVKAQMPKNNTDNYLECVKGCERLSNSELQKLCVEGCACKCPTLSLRVLNATTSYTAVLTKNIIRNEDVLIHADKIANGKTYVDFEKGVLKGYYNVNAKGIKEPCPILVYATGKIKRYYIYDTSGKYLEIIKPETPFKENVGLIAKG